MKTRNYCFNILIFLSISAFGQNNADSLSNEEETLLAPVPVYKDGGDKGLLNFVSNNIRYPKGQHLNGNVYVALTVDSLGNVKNEKVINGLTKEADSEALRIVRLMKFTPAIAMGKPRTVQHHVIINFNSGEK